MLFFKAKPKTEELLPPPPPFPSMEFKEPVEEPGLLAETIKPEERKAKALPEEEEFHNLVKEWDEVIKQLGKKGKKGVKKALIKNKKISKSGPKQLKKAQLRQIKKKTQPKIKAKKMIRLPKLAEFPELEEAGIEDLELRKELESPSEIELPERLEELDIGGFEKELVQAPKPKEIIEAEEEIKSAIENIKWQKKPSLFKRLFVKKKLEPKPAEEHLMQEIPEVDDVSAIQNRIGIARQALMKSDLETAKKRYIEAMELYNKIKPEEQARVYQDIKELYFERKSAEQLKV